MTSYAPLPVTFAKGNGIWLQDEQGERYLDALGGIAVCGLGHAHPHVASAIAEQAHTLLHTSNVYHIGVQEKLADELTRVAKMDKVFFCNSGAEANEAAIKLARLHARAKGFSDQDTPVIVVMQGSFHGRTMATLSATGNPKVHSGFEPLVQGFVHIPYSDLEALQAVAQEHKNIVAVFCEPVQGEGGINVPPQGFLENVRAICDKHNWLMMLDEIQTGVGRTGEWFAYQHEDCLPDVMTAAKALGNGVPIGACMAQGKAAELFVPGSHGSTFGGNPLACSAALAVIETLEKDNLIEQARSRGDYLLDAFKQNLQDVEGVSEVRGKGLMIGIELDRPCADLVKQALDAKLLINVTAGNVIRLLPPLIITQAECDQLVTTLTTLIKSFLSE